jgi:uncharacterized protein (DUF58 family)
MPIRFTRLGWYYFFFSLAVGAAAINTGNNLLYLFLGLLLGLIILSGILSDSCLWGTRIQLHPFGDLYVGRESEWDVTLAKTWFPGVVLEAELFWKGLTASRVFFPFVPRHESRTVQATLTPQKRGALHLQGLRLSTYFPFGLLEKARRKKDHESWVVFPEIRPVSMSLLRAFGARHEEMPSMRRGQGSTPFDLRPFKQGDSSKRIHWKSTAKRGQWIVAEMEEESGISPMVFVSAWPSAAEIEPFISFVASIMTELNRRGFSVGLATPGISIKPGRSRETLHQVLHYLALVDPAHELRVVQAEPLPNGIDALNLWKAQS